MLVLSFFIMTGTFVFPFITMCFELCHFYLLFSLFLKLICYILCMFYVLFDVKFSADSERIQSKLNFINKNRKSKAPKQHADGPPTSSWEPTMYQVNRHGLGGIPCASEALKHLQKSSLHSALLAGNPQRRLQQMWHLSESPTR